MISAVYNGTAGGFLDPSHTEGEARDPLFRAFGGGSPFGTGAAPRAVCQKLPPNPPLCQLNRFFGLTIRAPAIAFQPRAINCNCQSRNHEELTICALLCQLNRFFGLTIRVPEIAFQPRAINCNCQLENHVELTICALLCQPNRFFGLTIRVPGIAFQPRAINCNCQLENCVELTIGYSSETQKNRTAKGSGNAVVFIPPSALKNTSRRLRQEPPFRALRTLRRPPQASSQRRLRRPAR